MYFVDIYSLEFYESLLYDVPGSAMQHELFRRVVVSAAAWLDDKEFVQ